MDRKITFIVIGAVFWAVAASFMHFVGPYVFDGGWKHAAFWLANFLLPALALPVIAKMTARTKHDMLAPMALAAMSALLMDAIAVTFDTMGKTHIYADNAQLAGYTGGFLLFAFWSFFFWALVWHREK